MEDKEIELNNKECQCQECNEEEVNNDAEDVLGQIAVQQEIERWELQNNPIAELSEKTSNSEFFNESIIYAETVGTVFQTLLGYGIDYQNAISMANNIMISDQNLKQAKIQNVQIQSQQL